MATGVGVINHNISAINSLRTLQGTNNSVSNNLKRLSSGLRINTAADDAAGLAVSEKMRGQISGLNQAERNAQDGISMIQTAEGVLDSTHSILQRMRVLAVQGSNDSYTSYDRRRIQEEMDLLVDEIDRVAEYTEFNRKKLMDGTTIGHANASDVRTLTADVTGVVANADYSITVLSAGTPCRIHGNRNVVDGPDADNIVNLRDIGVTDTEEFHIVVNEQTHVIDFHEDDTLKDVLYKINTSGAPVKAGLDNEGNDITITSTHSGPKYNISFGDDPDGLAMRLGLHGGVKDTLTSATEAHDLSGDDLGVPLYRSGTETMISITNITQQAQFPTAPGNVGEPGGHGQSLGVFVSDSRVFGERELARPINKTEATKGFPLWPDVTGDGQPDVVDLTNSNLLKGMRIHIDSEIDYGVLEQRDHTYEAEFADFLEVFPAEGEEGDLMTLNAADTSDIFELRGGIWHAVEPEDVFDYAAAGVPADDPAIYNLGETYIDTGTAEQYIFNGTTWDSEGVIDDNGGDYPQPWGESGDPDDTLGADGEFYVDSDTNDVYQRQSGSYEEIGNINFTNLWPNPEGQDVTGDGNTEYGDYHAMMNNFPRPNVATPGEEIWGRGDSFSLTSTRLSIRDTRQIYQIGANEGQTMITDFGNMTSETLGLSHTYRSGGVHHDGKTIMLNGARTQNLRQYISVQTQSDASNAITKVDEALDKVSRKRSELGAYQSALEKTIHYLSIAHENTQAAESRIRDVDMAKEMTDFTKNQVLMQSGTSMLAQANQKPQNVLGLLQ
ncbi:MAG: flagellin [Candidatus Muiribacteriota bacterium]